MTYYIEYLRNDGTWARDGQSEDYDTADQAREAIVDLESGDTDGAHGFRVAQH